MKIAVMQPYIFPYIGYYQLITAVDVFVILDDANYIVRGWINRNNILLDGKAHMFTVPLYKPSQNNLICSTKLNFSQKDRERFLKTIQQAYKKAPYFNEFYAIFEALILFKNDDLTEYLYNSLVTTCDYLGIVTKFLRSSEINKDSSLKAERKILEICRVLNASTYINLPGGKSLYARENFEKLDIELLFIEPSLERIRYKQYNNNFVENLSILDIIMFNSRKDIGRLLDQYRLVKGDNNV
jgi:hypothetical protein